MRVSNPARNWTRALQEMEKARDRIINQKWTEKCLNTLGLLGVSAAQIVQLECIAECWLANS